ncbi:MAG TPA: DUF58 domain-containing protein [Candidatus Cloacimonas acidaminovorans]|nr:DUF58 domain-containing protein [Candidatus Cloacimonas acidaminovorans]HOT39301.1 DUF58 domain-containing protein [Candidatus Cloacimonas acidaminovorans]HQF35787.1 DUF58 domain-containing protein [Candidatus Cloacimonas acidaminovorans]
MFTQSVSDILKKIRRIEIRTRNPVAEIFRGEYHSRFKGQGLEFSEVREYQPGDNYRDIDWNVSARLGQLYIKKYRETRELRVVFLVDVSASQEFGTRSMIKRERIAELVAALAFSAVANQDLAGLILFSDRVEKFLPPRKGRNNALAILREVLYYEPKSKKTSLQVACEYAHKMLKKRCILFIISDWIDSGYEHSLKILATKNDVIAIRVLDDSELELPRAGILSLQDPETGEEVWINSSDSKLRKAYQEIVNKEQKDLEEFFSKCNCDYLLIRTSESYINSLRKFFTLRERRR